MSALVAELLLERARDHSVQSPLSQRVKETSVENEHNPAVESLRREQKTQRREERELTPDQKLDKALKDTFPASDPVAEQVPITPGAAEETK